MKIFTWCVIFFTKVVWSYSLKSTTCLNRWWLKLTQFTINTCKSYGCRNLGQPIWACADFSWPDYRLGFPALHCRACGSYPPLFDEQQFNEWLSVHLSAYASENGHFCPECYRKEIICYGHNPQGTQRVQCRVCRKVWTPKQQEQRKIVPPERIETVSLVVPFQGAVQNRNCMFYSVLMPSAVMFCISPQILLSIMLVRLYGIAGTGMLSLIYIIVIS